MKMYRIVCLIFIMLLCSCGEKHKSSGYKPDIDLIHAYTELIMLQKQFAPSFPACQDSSLQILENHHLNQDTFRMKINELNRVPERWEVFLQHVLEQLQNLEKNQRVPPVEPKSSGRRLVR